VTAIQANPAHDLLVVDESLLVPIVFVTDVREGHVVVDLPDGFVEATTTPARRPRAERPSSGR
jgi:ribosomal 30S subunit maturation factor RimM